MWKPGTWFVLVHGEYFRMFRHRTYRCRPRYLQAPTLATKNALHWSALSVALLASTLLAGCATSSTSAESTLGPQQAAATSGAPALQTNAVTAKPILVATSASPVATGAYTIGPLDVLDISVFQVPELTKSVQVSDTGTINLPLVGEVQVAGKTPQQVERDLTARLGAKYLQNPQVTVYVKEYNSQQLTVEGNVTKPGVFPIKGKTSLLQVIAMAGGMGDTSDWTVLVLRQSNGRRQAAKFDVDAIQNGKADDPVMQSGDIVIAGTSAIKKGFGTVLKALPIAGLFAFL
jgi:polysaccharide export outer membrane protein